jgi:hypothetical protein
MEFDFGTYHTETLELIHGTSQQLEQSCFSYERAIRLDKTMQ